MPLYDFHAHTFLSDGTMLATELARRGIVNGYAALAITDHASASNARFIADSLARDVELLHRHWDFTLIPGVELTHLPASAIGEIARNAKFDGAKIVLVHGETPVEPVEPGTNRAAVQSPHVDILAHPGLLTEEEARIAAQNGVFLEITARSGHAQANNHVVQIGRAAGARFLINSDAHTPGDLLTKARALEVARDAGLREEELNEVLMQNPLALLRKLGYSL